MHTNWKKILCMAYVIYVFIIGVHLENACCEHKMQDNTIVQQKLRGEWNGKEQQREHQQGIPAGLTLKFLKESSYYAAHIKFCI